MTNLLLKTSNVTCEKRCLHSALGGGAAPLFLFKSNTYQVLCMSIEHIYMRHIKAQEV